MVVGRQPDHPGAEQRAAGKVERSDRLTRCKMAHLCLAGLDRKSGEIGGGQQRGARARLVRRSDDCHRLPAFVAEGGAQHLVPADDFADRVAERGDVQFAPQPHGGRHVVERVAWLQAVEKPEALLAK